MYTEKTKALIGYAVIFGNICKTQVFASRGPYFMYLSLYL